MTTPTKACVACMLVIVSGAVAFVWRSTREGASHAALTVTRLKIRGTYVPVAGLRLELARGTAVDIESLVVPVCAWTSNGKCLYGGYSGNSDNLIFFSKGPVISYYAPNSRLRQTVREAISALEESFEESSVLAHKHGALPAQMYDRAMYDRAAGGGGDLTVTRSNQSSWDNIVDTIASNSAYQAARKEILDRICNDIRSAGCEDGDHTIGDIVKETSGTRSPLAPEFSDTPALRHSIQNGYSTYSWTKKGKGRWLVTIRIEGTYSFDKFHALKKMQDRGLITPYKWVIEMESVEIGCPCCNK